MADVTVEFGATDTGLEKTLKAVQDELIQLKGKVSSGELSMTELESTMKRIGQVTSMEKNIKAIGNASDETSVDVKELGSEMDSTSNKGEMSFGKIGIAAGIAGAAVKVGMKVVELAMDAARALVDDFGAALDLGGKLQDLSTQTGATAGDLLLLQKAFTNAGKSADDVGIALNKMQKFMADASEGGKTQNEVLAKLGLIMSDLAGKTPTQQMEVFARAIAGVQDPTLRTQIAMELFGKSGGSLIPVLADLSGGLEQAKGQLGSLPKIMTDSAKVFDDFGDNFEDIKNKTVQFAAGVLSVLLPALKGLSDRLSGIDAAGWGVTAMKYVESVAATMIGAFKDPLKFIDAYGLSLDVAAKTFGNALLNGALTFIDFLVKASSTTLPSAITGFIGSALVDAALSFDRTLVQGLMTFATAIANIPGLEAVGEAMFAGLDKFNEDIIRQQQQSMGNTKAAAEEVVNQFNIAKGHTKVFKEDFFGAEDATKKMNVAMGEMEASGKETLGSFKGAEGSASNANTSILNAANNSGSINSNFQSAANSAYGAESSQKETAKSANAIAVSWAAVAGSAYTSEQSTVGALAAMVKGAREMSQTDFNTKFSDARQSLRDMGGDFKAMADKSRDIKSLATALGLDSDHPPKILIQEIGQEIDKLGKAPIEINIKFDSQKFQQGLQSLWDNTTSQFANPIPLTLNAAKSIGEQAIAASDGFKNPIPLNLKGYDSIADARKAAEANFANPIPLTMSGDSAANDVYGIVKNAFGNPIDTSLDMDINDAQGKITGLTSAPSTLGVNADITPAETAINNLVGTPAIAQLQVDQAQVQNAIGHMSADIRNNLTGGQGGPGGDAGQGGVGGEGGVGGNAQADVTTISSLVQECRDWLQKISGSLPYSVVIP